MKKNRKAYSLIFISLIFSLLSISEALHANESQIKEDKQINAEADVDSNHPEIPEGVTCADCHEIKFDAKTTATQVWLTGNYAGFSPDEGIMDNRLVKEAIVKEMGGRKQCRTSILATCINNVPTSSTAEYVLDPQDMALYGVHEKGTAKLLHLKQNPRFSLNWHREFKNWGETLCIQFVGTAELIDGNSPEYEKILKEIYPYEEGADARKIPHEKYIQMAKQMMLISRLTVKEATITNIKFREKGKRPWQRWVRHEDDDKNLYKGKGK